MQHVCKPAKSGFCILEQLEHWSYMGNEFAYDMTWTVRSQDGPTRSDSPTVDQHPAQAQQVYG